MHYTVCNVTIQTQKDTPAEVWVEQAESIERAKQAEARVIVRSNPTYNEQGKTK
ncbi:MAG TPA: hypothetical protein VN494_05860 [Patescibacteria group bacterium]|nr:hypothetical protein [Patescibacteria group bacterium]